MGPNLSSPTHSNLTPAAAGSRATSNWTSSMTNEASCAPSRSSPQPNTALPSCQKHLENTELVQNSMLISFELVLNLVRCICIITLHLAQQFLFNEYMHNFQLYIYFNGYDVHGSPHMFRVGSRSKKPRDSASPLPAYARVSSPGKIRIKIYRIL